jgi:hypothetical protein
MRNTQVLFAEFCYFPSRLPPVLELSEGVAQESELLTAERWSFTTEIDGT